MESRKEGEMAEVYEKLRERLDMFPQGYREIYKTYMHFG
jgi:hypothetical protein